MIQPAGYSRGILSCFFGMSDAEEVSVIRIGEEVTLVGTFQEVERKPTGALVIMNSCSIEDS